MARYVALLRGINVGGKNLIKMPALKAAFETDGFRDVRTYIQSGNVIFLKEPLTAGAAMAHVPTHPAVDAAHAGIGVLYFSRLEARATQSRLSKIVSSPIYPNVTIRNWNTTTKLLSMME